MSSNQNYPSRGDWICNKCPNQTFTSWREFENHHSRHAVDYSMSSKPVVMLKRLMVDPIYIKIKRKPIDGQSNFKVEPGCSGYQKNATSHPASSSLDAIQELDSSRMFPGSCESRSPSPDPISPKPQEQEETAAIPPTITDNPAVDAGVFEAAEKLMIPDSGLPSVIPLTPETPANALEEEEEENVVSAMTTPVKSSVKSTESNRTIENTPAALSLADSSVHLNSPVSEPAGGSGSSSSTEEVNEEPVLPMNRGQLRLVPFESLMSPSFNPPTDDDDPSPRPTPEKTSSVKNVETLPGPMVVIPGQNLETMLIQQQTTTSTIVTVQQQQQQQQLQRTATAVPTSGNVHQPPAPPQQVPQQQQPLATTVIHPPVTQPLQNLIMMNQQQQQQHQEQLSQQLQPTHVQLQGFNQRVQQMHQQQHLHHQQQQPVVFTQQQQQQQQQLYQQFAQRQQQQNYTTRMQQPVPSVASSNYNYSTITSYNSTTANFTLQQQQQQPITMYHYQVVQNGQQQQQPQQPPVASFPQQQQQQQPTPIAFAQQQQQQQPRTVAPPPHYNNRPLYQPNQMDMNIRSMVLQTSGINGVNAVTNVQLQQQATRFPVPQQNVQLRNIAPNNAPPSNGVRMQHAANPNVPTVRPQQQQQQQQQQQMQHRPVVSSATTRPSMSTANSVRPQGLAPVPTSAPRPIRPAGVHQPPLPGLVQQQQQQRISNSNSATSNAAGQGHQQQSQQQQRPVVVTTASSTQHQTTQKRPIDAVGGGPQTVSQAKVPRIENAAPAPTAALSGTGSRLTTAAAEAVAKISNKDCEVVVVQMKNTGMPIIQSVQGATPSKTSPSGSSAVTTSSSSTTSTTTDSVTTLHNNPNITITPIKPSTSSSSRPETVDLTGDKRPPQQQQLPPPPPPSTNVPTKGVIGNKLACQVCNLVCVSQGQLRDHISTHLRGISTSSVTRKPPPAYTAATAHPPAKPAGTAAATTPARPIVSAATPAPVRPAAPAQTFNPVVTSVSGAAAATATADRSGVPVISRVNSLHPTASTTAPTEAASTVTVSVSSTAAVSTVTVSSSSVNPAPMTVSDFCIPVIDMAKAGVMEELGRMGITNFIPVGNFISMSGADGGEGSRFSIPILSAESALRLNNLRSSSSSSNNQKDQIGGNGNDPLFPQISGVINLGKSISRNAPST